MSLPNPSPTYEATASLSAEARITVYEQNRFAFQQIGENAAVTIDADGNITIDWSTAPDDATARIELKLAPADTGPAWQFVGVTLGWGREVGPPRDHGVCLRCWANLETVDREVETLCLELEKPKNRGDFTYAVEVDQLSTAGSGAQASRAAFVIDPKITNQGDGVGGPPPEG